jgi:ATP-binding cassette subfamily D (ALD) long-chain fatty acid import protein
MFEDFVVKYSWSSVGFIVCSLPVFWPEWAGMTQIDNEEEDPNMDKRTSSNTKVFTSSNHSLSESNLTLHLRDL